MQILPLQQNLRHQEGRFQLNSSEFSASSEPSASSQSSERKISPVNVIAASAGTGKTYRLSQEYVAGLQQTSDESNAGILATTFTVKAASELMERVRGALLAKGEWHAAQGVLGGYLGTINSLCGRILSEHAISAGLSPDLAVIAEERLPAVFAVAVDSVMHEYADHLRGAAHRMKMDKWEDRVQEVIDLARNYDIEIADLQRFALSSWQNLEALFPQAQEKEEVLDANLVEAIELALASLRSVFDPREATKANLDILESAHRRMKSGLHLTWEDWAQLGSLKETKATSKTIRLLRLAASKHDHHPRLRRDIKDIIDGVFGCAAGAMQEYAEFKRTHGLIDFIDQETLALSLLGKPEVQQMFREHVRTLLVDEFQDTSPIQLAVFLEMAKLVDNSVWVGDEKQSIFGFRGSDPELMQSAVAQLVSITGGTTEKLTKSYRSRPQLVQFTNSLFSLCAQSMQISEGSALIEHAHRAEIPGQEQPLHLWWLANSNPAEALALAVANMVAEPERWPIVNKNSGTLASIRGSDIAILCRSNKSRIKVASALAACGLTVATERNFLRDTPECMLALAALRVLVDESDTLAVAELAKLCLPDDDGRWLQSLLTTGQTALTSEIEYLPTLQSAREHLYDRTPSEALELAITCSGVIESCAAWGSVRQRLSNLDALRGLAQSYEELCRCAKLPATCGGLIEYLYKVPDGGNQPANPDENGIHVLTYHKSKGLEWPVVILFDLDTPLRVTAFGVRADGPPEGIDPLKPLAGRTIRFWPWPYGKRSKDIRLDQSVARAGETMRVSARETAESLRLLYVGMTRARDYLILAGKASGTSWLDILKNRDGEKILYLPMDTDCVLEEEIIPGVPSSKTRIEFKSDDPAFAERLNPALDTAYGALAQGMGTDTGTDSDRGITNAGAKFKPYYLRPSEATWDDLSDWHEPALDRHSGTDDRLGLTHTRHNATSATLKPTDGKAYETIVLGARLNLAAVANMQVVGDCVHAFLAIDDVNSELSARTAMAVRILANWSVQQMTADDLTEAGDRLANFVQGRYPQARWNREFPLAGKLGQRRLKGSIDLLLETEHGYVIIDHKTFPGGSQDWPVRVSAHAPQLATYKYLLERAMPGKVIATYIHMAVGGVIIRVE